MKKSLFIILFLLFIPALSFAATRTIANGGGNWSATGTWVEGAVPTTADDVVATATSGNVTIDTTTCVASTMILTNYVGTMTFTAGQKLTVTSTVTFVAGMTVSGTGTLKFGSTSTTITSGGLSLPINLEFAGGTKTLGDNWDVNGSVTISATTTINGNTMNIATNLSVNSSSGAGTTNFVLDGTGTWLSNVTTSAFNNSININTAGTITLGNFVIYGVGTLTYTAGTVDATTNNNQLRISSSCILNTGGITWNDVFLPSSVVTITLASDFTIAKDLAISVTIAFAGAYNISCLNFTYINIALGNRDLTLVAGQTLTITNGLFLNGGSDYTLTIKSSVASSATYLNYSGTPANCQVYEMTFTDVDASGSAQGLDNWYGGTLTRTTNITNRTSADIGVSGGCSAFVL